MAAGAGHRLGCSVPKAFVTLAGRTLLAHALERAVTCPEVNHVVVVAPPTYLTPAHDASADVADADPAGARVAVDVVAGGRERTESVARGLAALHPDDGLVLVHDAARCLAPPELFSRVIAALRHGHAAVVPGVPVVDTIKRVDADGLVVDTPDRDALRAIQTPQGFVREVLERAHAAGRSATDDAALVEAQGTRVVVVPGDPWAHKITTPEDLERTERLLADPGPRARA